jgi:putative heme-binding domain-containing protein
LQHPNKWQRQTAVRLLGERKDPEAVSALRQLLHQEPGPVALEALWALNWMGSLEIPDLHRGLSHRLPSVRAWCVRLLGDRPSQDPASPQALFALAHNELSAEVRSQLASSARRFPLKTLLPLLAELLTHSEDVTDLHIPLLLWWALEHAFTTDFQTTSRWLQQHELWKNPLFIQHLAPRIFKRCAAVPTHPHLLLSAALLEKLVPDETRNLALTHLEFGFRGHGHLTVPAQFREVITGLWPQTTPPHALIQIGFRIGMLEAENAALRGISQKTVPLQERLELIELLGEHQFSSALEPLLDLVSKKQESKIVRSALRALQRFEDPRIPTALLAPVSPFQKELLPDVIAILSSRGLWAYQLLLATERNQIRREDIPTAALLGIQSFRNPECDALIRKLWSQLRPSSQAKDQRIRQIRTQLKSGTGDPEKGRSLFASLCSTCHTFRGEGGKIGPDLTGYERSNLDFLLPAIVDPSLAVREEFTAFEVTTIDRQALVGFITDESPQTLTLLDLSQQTNRIPRSQVAGVRALATSLMPEGLLDSLSDTQIRDLFAYITLP